jgi:TolB-like protein
MNLSSLFTELKRRNVLRMAGLYLVGAWLLTQVASTLLPAFDAPSWALRGLIITLALGFIPAVIFSWVFELTPQGLKRDQDVAPEQSITPQTGRRMDRMIIVVLVLAVGYFAFDKFVLAPRREAALVSSAVPNESKSVVNAKSIAVLPFENLSEEKANAFFTDGVQDQILSNLAQIADLKVISRTSVMQYKSGAPRNLREIGRQLGVAHVVEGRLQRAANKVRVIAQLIDARNDTHLWHKPTIAIWPMCSPSKARSPRQSPISCRRSSHLTRRKPLSSRRPLTWPLSTFTAMRSHCFPRHF